MISSRPAFLRTERIKASSVFPLGSMLYFKVPLYIVGSYGMIVIFSLTYLKLISLISTPSIRIWPASFSTILVRARLNVLFPAPVLPTTPTLSPALIFILHPLRTSSVVGLYLSSTSLISISPFCGHYSSSCLGCSKFSCGISRSFRHLLTETIFDSVFPRLCKNPVIRSPRLITHWKATESKTVFLSVLF